MHHKPCRARRVHRDGNRHEPAIKERAARTGHGRIIVTSSPQGQHGTKHGAAYSASKWGIIGLMKSAALGFGEHKITVNALIRGLIDTALTRHKDRYRQAAEEGGKQSTGDAAKEQELAKQLIMRLISVNLYQVDKAERCKCSLGTPRPHRIVSARQRSRRLAERYRRVGPLKSKPLGKISRHEERTEVNSVYQTLYTAIPWSAARAASGLEPDLRGSHARWSRRYDRRSFPCLMTKKSGRFCYSKSRCTWPSTTSFPINSGSRRASRSGLSSSKTASSEAICESNASR